jgi:hypothetical protein
MQWNQYGEGKELNIMNNRVSILGTEYIILQDCNTTENLNNKGLDGETNLYSKIISIHNMSNMLDVDSPNYEKEARYKETMRHEIIHAFFHESGLEDYCNDEVLVDWLAKQWNKMSIAFQEALEDCNE